MMTIYDFSFDPRDPRLPLPEASSLAGVRWGIQLFTTQNVYILGSEHVQTVLEPGGTTMLLRCSGLAWAGGQRAAPGKIVAALSLHGGELTWRIEAWHDEPIKAVKLLLYGLPDEILNKGWWHATAGVDAIAYATPEMPLRWRYPWHDLLTPWACAGDDEGAICVSVHDPQVRAKRLYVSYPRYNDQRSIVEIVCEQDATAFGPRFVAPPIVVRHCTSKAAIAASFREHLAFVENAYALPLWETRPDAPPWLRDVRLVLNLHGQHWTGYVFNTFDRMADALRLVASHIPGEQVLAYLPGWEGRYYHAYPNYAPGEALGGDASFRRLAATARELGVHLMPMFGMHGANAGEYPGWRKAIFRNRTDRYSVFVNFPDWDLDRSGEDDQIFLNPGEPNFRAHLVEQVSRTVETYGVDGVFLDTSACWFNDPRYNQVEGYRKLLGALHERFPTLLIAGEGWWDALLGLFPVSQSWLGTDREYRFPELLTRYARALGHLMTGTPGGSTGVHELGYALRPQGSATFGHIPALGIVDDTLERHRADIIRVCQDAARLETAR
jgi:hypothetical protein